MNQNVLLKPYIQKIIQNIVIDEQGYHSTFEEKLRDQILKSCHNTYSKKHISFVPGSAQGLIDIFNMLKQTYNTCICYSKTFTFVEHLLKDWNKKTIKVNLQPDDHIDYILDVILKNSEEPTVIYLPNPNNPTGHKINSKILYDLIKKYPSHIFIIDEAYSFDSITKYPLLSNMIITQTLSKKHGLAFLRLGWTISNFKELDTTGKYLVGSYQYNLGYNVLTQCNIDILELFTIAKAYTSKHLDKFTHYLCDMWFFIYVGENIIDIIDELKNNNILVKNSDIYNLYGWIRLSYISEIDLINIINIINKFNITPYNELFFTDYRKRKCKELLRELSKNLKIPWWCTDGTLLGVRRFSDIIPWDDDIDIGILKEHENLFLSHDFNLRIRKNRTGVYYQADFGIEDEPLQSEHIDIFLYSLVNNTYINTDPRFVENNESNKCFNMTYTKEQLLPLQTDLLDDINVLVPNIINNINIEKVNNVKYEKNNTIIHKPLFYEYCKYGSYKRDFLQVTNSILEFLNNIVITDNQIAIFDLDDTILCNARWFNSNKYLIDDIKLYENTMKNDIGIINPNMKQILDKCKTLNIKLICITGRYEYQEELTKQNLKMFDIHFDKIYYRPSDKFSCVCEYKKSFNFDNVLFAVGDQPSDIINYNKTFLLPRCHISECIHHDKFKL